MAAAALNPPSALTQSKNRCVMTASNQLPSPGMTTPRTITRRAAHRIWGNDAPIAPEPETATSLPLVTRFRSSHHCAAHSFANFGIKGTLAIYDSSAVFGFEVPTQTRGYNDRNFKSTALGHSPHDRSPP